MGPKVMMFEVQLRNGHGVMTFLYPYQSMATLGEALTKILSNQILILDIKFWGWDNFIVTPNENENGVLFTANQTGVRFDTSVSEDQIFTEFLIPKYQAQVTDVWTYINAPDRR